MVLSILSHGLMTGMIWGTPPWLWKPPFISPMRGDLLTYQQLLWYCGSLFFASWVELQLNLSLVDLHHQSWDPPVSWQFLSLANMWLPTENVEITNHINHYGYKWVLTTHTWRAWSGVLTPVETRWSPQSKLNPSIHLFEYQRMRSWGDSHSFSWLQADNLPKTVSLDSPCASIPKLSQTTITHTQWYTRCFSRSQ